MKKSQGEEALALQLRALGMGGWVREHRFHPSRRWRFDFAHEGVMIAVEVEGFGGRHQTNEGFRKDLEKYDEAMRLGWLVYRCSAQMVKSGRAIETIGILLDLKTDG